MKYLLQAIQAQRASIALSDNELRQLITDVQRGRDSREEFLESIERVLSELRGYTEHSAAFLAKVSKRDAPDYYDVIKHPMDLGTMQKKVKMGGYKNKKQFAHDLDLIWDNCLVYNSDPSHPLRRNVHFMRKKANHLLNYVHDKNDVNDALREWDLVQRTWAGQENIPNGPDGAAAGVLVSNEAALDIRSALPTADIPFEQRPALLRDPQGMASFLTLDQSLAAFERNAFGGWEAEWARAGPSSAAAGAWRGKAAEEEEQEPVAGPSRLPEVELLQPDALRSTLKSMRMQGPFHMALTTARGERTDAPGGADAAAGAGGVNGTANGHANGPAEPSSSSSGSLSPGPSTPAALGGRVNGKPKKGDSHAASPAPGAFSAKGKEKEVPVVEEPTVIIPSPFDDVDQRIPAGAATAQQQKQQGKQGAAEAAAAAAGTRPLSRADPEGLVGSWWDSIVSNDLIANGLPALPRSAALSAEDHALRVERLKRRQRILKARLAKPTGSSSAKRRRQALEDDDDEDKWAVDDPRRLKRVRNRIPESIRALQKLRRTHLRLGVLVQANAGNEEVPEWVLEDSASEEEESDAEDEEAEGEPPEAGGGVREADPGEVFATLGFRNPHARISPHTARERFLHVTRLLMAHHGLQGSTKAPLEALANMGIMALSNIGRALRSYSDRYAHKMSAEEMITHTLQEVTNTDVPALEGYIRHNVERHCGRVKDLLRKVKTAYDGQIQQTADRNAEQHEAMFADGADAFTAGNFADEIGDDFFGFKELGLDQEFGIGGLSVPTRLIHGRGRAALAGASGLAASAAGPKAGVDVLPYVPPEPYVLLDSQGVSAQIGLLQPFLRERLREHKRAKSRAKEEVTQEEMEHMPDDEEMIVGPDSKLKNLKVPPTGKLPKRRLWAPKTRPTASAPVKSKGTKG